MVKPTTAEASDELEMACKNTETADALISFERQHFRNARHIVKCKKPPKL